MVDPFDNIESGKILAQDNMFMVVFDGYPVSPGHLLIVVKRKVAKFRDLNFDEHMKLTYWISWCIEYQYTVNKADSINMGLNDGPEAGQTVARLHVHVIPRFKGDVEDPRGGVRWVVPSKAKYWR
jgi:diadenosine tetraphosphate (Ap4A) HIT family hydrolase